MPCAAQDGSLFCTGSMNKIHFFLIPLFALVFLIL